MAVEIKWTQQSIEDLQHIAAFISKESPYYAQIQIEKFFEKTLILETYPKAGRVVPELATENIRELIEGNYRIIYRIVTNLQVDVLSVHHSSKILKDLK